MKVGDWVRTTTGADNKPTIFKIEKISKEDNEIFLENSKYSVQKMFCELWQPKEGEWCWSKYDGLVQILKITDERYIVFPLSTSEKDCTIEYRLGGLEPFVGELPSFIKDKQ